MNGSDPRRLRAAFAPTLLALAALAVVAPVPTPVLAQANTATSKDAQLSRLYEDALSRFASKDFPGAIIQVKNALKLDAKNLSAQMLLGRALLEDGQVNAAEVAFDEALRLGASRAEVVAPQARAVVGQGRSDLVLSDKRFELAQLPPPVQYELLIVRAAAATDTGDLKAALKAVADARAIDPNNVGSWLAEVPARIRGRQLKEALAAANQAVKLAPDNAEAYFVRGESLHVVPDLNGAVASYDKAIQLEPAHVGALVARAGVHMDFNRLDAAAADVAAVLKKSPKEARATYLKGLIADRQGRPAEARAAMNDVTALIDVIPPAFLRYRPLMQMLGGMAHHALGQYAKAKPYFEGMLRGQPGHAAAKVMASMLLSERSYDAAIDVLDGYLRSVPNDPQAMLLLASAHMAQGRHARATQITQQALKITDRTEIRTTLGLSLVGGGRFAEAIKELEAVVAKDPRNLQAGYALASLYVQGRQVGPATRVAEALAKAHPRNPGVLNLLAGARRLKGDAAQAKAAYEGALAADPANLPAQLGLARLDMDARDWTAAAAKLNAAFARDEKNVETAMMIAELSLAAGKPDDAQRWLKRADELAGLDNIGPALALVDFHLGRGQVPLAQEALRRAQSKLPDALQTILAAARVQVASGDLPSARSQLARAATLTQNNAPALVSIASMQMQTGAYAAAAYTLDKALTEQPSNASALAMRAETDIRLGDLAQAEQRIKRLQTLQPRGAAAATLAGDLASARKQPDAALAAYRRAHELEKSSATMIRLMAATMRRDKAAGIKLGEQWVAAQPNDVTVRRALADSQFGTGQFAEARRGYEALLKLQPRDADALNNLAHVLIQAGDAPAALQAAEKALALTPEAPHVIGTAGWTAFKAGQNDRAIQLLRNARLRDPGNADTRYFLASVLAAMGRAVEARPELVAALQDGSGLNYRREAEQLLGTLR